MKKSYFETVVRIGFFVAASILFYLLCCATNEPLIRWSVLFSLLTGWFYLVFIWER